jgi:glycosyltransferase involved in cell wall biosynthesis
MASHALHIITDLRTGGAEVMLVKLLAALDHSRFAATVIALQGGRLAQEIEALGIPVYDLALGSALSLPQAAASLWRLTRRLKPDMIQGWMYHGNLAASLCRRSLWPPRPLFWNIRQALYDLAETKRSTRCLIRGLAFLSHMPAAIIYNTEASAVQHEKLGYARNRRVIIANGFTCETFHPWPEARLRLRQELGVSEGTPLIGLIARYHPIKDHATFLRAAAVLRRSEDGVHFVLAGEGVHQGNQALTLQVSELQLADRVHLLGERRDMPYLQAALDIATLSSYGEGFPNSVGEAMSCGVPCIVTAVGEAPALVGDTGFVVEPRQPLTMAQAWQRLLSLPVAERERLGKAARARILTHYTIAHIANEYARLYESALEGTVSCLTRRGR